MSDFIEVEQELKKLRPLPPSAELLSRIEGGINAGTPAVASLEQKAPTPVRLDWLWLGATLAAAAIVLLFVHFQVPSAKHVENTVANSPAPATRPPTAVTQVQFVPDSSTRVVYHAQDEGLLFADGSDQPVRRLRTFVRETQRWHNPATGASLRVSYPSEQIELIPVAGQ
jgi:hypothetical protein